MGSSFTEDSLALYNFFNDLVTSRNTLDTLDISAIDCTALLPASPALHSGSKLHASNVPSPSSATSVSSSSPSPPPRETPIFKSFTYLPPELRDLVIIWILAKNPKARIPLLLSSRAVNASTHYLIQEAVGEYVRNEYGSVAATLFPPKQDSMTGIVRWEQYLSGLEKAMDRITAVCAFVRTQLESLSSASAVAGVAWLDVDSLTATLKTSLYLVELIHWHRPSPTEVKEVLNSLPSHALLILRQLSLLLTLTCHDRICQELEKAHRDRDLIRDKPAWSVPLGLNQDPYSIIRAIETMLLSNGCQHLAAIVSPDMPHPFDRPVLASLGKKRYKHAYAKWSVRLRKVEAAKTEALYGFVKSIEVVRVYAQFPPCRLRDSQKTEIVSRRLHEEYGAGVPFYSVALEDVVKWQDLVEAEVAERPEMEVMKELKMASGL